LWPQTAAFDPKAKKLLSEAIPYLGEKNANFWPEVIKAIKSGVPNEMTKLLDSLSLNRIRVVVGGVMTVDADTVPASIEGVSFDESDAALLWAEPGTKTGTIQGRFLGGGKVTILNAAKVQITNLAVIQDGSSSESLRFSLKVNRAITAGATLTFRVDKVDKSQKPVQGIPFEYPVKPVLLTAPEIGDVERSGDVLTITGKRFFSTDENALAVKLRARIGVRGPGSRREEVREEANGNQDRPDDGDACPGVLDASSHCGDDDGSGRVRVRAGAHTEDRQRQEERLANRVDGRTVRESESLRQGAEVRSCRTDRRTRF